MKSRNVKVVSIIIIPVIILSIIIPMLIFFNHSPINNGNGSRSITPLVEFHDSSSSFRYGLAYTSGIIEINGSLISAGYVNSTICDNTTIGTWGSNWNAISLFNDVQLRIISVDRDFSLIAYESSSIVIESLNTNYSIRIGFYDSSTGSISNANLSEVVCYGSSNVSISSTNVVKWVNSFESAQVSVIGSNITTFETEGKSKANITNCTINQLRHGIYISSGTLTITSSSITGSYINGTTINNCTITTFWLYSISVYGFAIVDVKSYSGSLYIWLYNNSFLNATNSNSPSLSLYGNSESSMILNNSVIGSCFLIQEATAIIENSSHSYVSTYDNSQMLISKNSSVTIAAWAYGFSNLTINNSTISSLSYSIYYTTGTITITNGILPGGYINCCTIIDSPPPSMNLGDINFKGLMTVTIVGVTPGYTFYAIGNVIMNLNSVSGGSYMYNEDSSGEITDSDVTFISSQVKANGLVTIRNSTSSVLTVSGIRKLIVVQDNSNIGMTDVWFVRVS